MESLMTTTALAPDLAQDLRETNSRMRFWLDSLLRQQAGAKPSPATPQQMAGLLSELMRAGQRLRALPAQKEPELQYELNLYRKNVERLHAVLPAIQSTLLAERARLEKERVRVESAAEWVRGSRQTL
jgi:hypothetical protein